MTGKLSACCLLAFDFYAMTCRANPDPMITVDFAKPVGKLRALHGFNNGPFSASADGNLAD